MKAWQPKLHPSESLHEAFFMRCQQVEREILGRIDFERRFNANNFDSGWAVEEIIRHSLSELLPSRYSVRAGSLSDVKGYSAGDCDVVIFNQDWFPAIKAAPTKESRRTYLPVEGAYGVLEVKQTLTRKSLDEAMEKLVVCSRLFRPSVAFDRVVENDTRNACTHFISNPLFTAVVAADLNGDHDREKLIERFIRINQLLPRKDVVHALCILGKGMLSWGANREVFCADPLRPKDFGPATFMSDDRYAELIPVYRATDPSASPFYELVTGLMNHLFASVLGPENVTVHYGQVSGVSIPATAGCTLVPDAALLNDLNDDCVGKHVCTESEYHRKGASTLRHPVPGAA